MDDENYNSLDFMFSAAGIDATIPNTRQWSIKVCVINDTANMHGYFQIRTFQFLTIDLGYTNFMWIRTESATRMHAMVLRKPDQQCKIL